MSEDQRRAKERNKLSSEVIVGVPIAFIAIGFAMAMTTVSYFSFGIVIATMGVVWLLVYWYIAIQTVGALLSILAAGVVIILFLMKLAPLVMSSFALEDDFEQGTVIGGIDWQNNYSEIRLNLDNPQYLAYENISLLIMANLPIANVGSLSTLSKCTYKLYTGQIIAPELKILGKDGSTIPLLTPESKGTMADQYQIFCDRALGRNNLELIIATVPGLFRKQRETASWHAAAFGERRGAGAAEGRIAFEQERGVAGQTVDLCDQERGAGQPSVFHSLGKLGPIVPLAALNFRE
jgi:hypothetical protein